MRFFNWFGAKFGLWFLNVSLADYMQRVVIDVDLHQNEKVLQPYMGDIAYFADEVRRLDMAPRGVIDVGCIHGSRPGLDFVIDKTQLKPTDLIDWLKTKNIIGTLDNDT